jgi:hypothetical protein
MIKVIKHGQTEFTHTCSRCGCEFTYEYEDIHTEAFGGLASNSTTSCYVVCPDCGNKCYIYSNNSNISWPWPTPGEPIPCNIPSDTALSPCSTCDWWKKMQQPGFTYVGDIPCTWCNKGPYKVTCDTSISTNATTPKLTLISGNTASTVQLNSEDLKKSNLNIYGHQSTSASNVIKNCNSCHKETKYSNNKNCSCKE